MILLHRKSLPTLTPLLVAGALGPLAFIPFGAILAAGFLFAWRFIPETRGRTLEQIEAMMRKER